MSWQKSFILEGRWIRMDLEAVVQSSQKINFPTIDKIAGEKPALFTAVSTLTSAIALYASSLATSLDYDLPVIAGLTAGLGYLFHRFSKRKSAMLELGLHSVKVTANKRTDLFSSIWDLNLKVPIIPAATAGALTYSSTSSVELSAIYSAATFACVNIGGKILRSEYWPFWRVVFENIRAGFGPDAISRLEKNVEVVPDDYLKMRLSQLYYEKGDFVLGHEYAAKAGTSQKLWIPDFFFFNAYEEAIERLHSKIKSGRATQAQYVVMASIAEPKSSELIAQMLQKFPGPENHFLCFLAL